MSDGVMQCAECRMTHPLAVCSNCTSLADAMSEKNKQGENCDCGSTAEHQRGPGCTLSTRGGGAVEVAPAYIVGTCLACGKQYDSRAGHECTPRPTPEERLAALESAVERIEARVMEGRPTPPGVFPPMGKADSGARADGMTPAEHHKRDHGCPHPIFRMLSEGSAFERVGCVNGEGFRKAEDVMRDVHPSVGVATVGGKATCPKCPESVESRATYARVPAHAGPTLAEAAIFGHGRFAPLGDAYQPACAECKRTGILLHVSRGTSASWLVCDDCDKPSAPAESIAVERGGYAPKSIGESDAQTRNGERHGARCCSNQGHSHAIWCPNHDAPCAECDAKSTATVGVGGRDGYVPGDDAEKAAFREATEERIADATRRMCEADARLTNASCSAGPIVGLDAMLPPISDLVTDKNRALMEKWGNGNCDAPTPATMLGEAVALLERVEALGLSAHANTRTMLSEVNFRVRVANVREHLGALKREAEARETRCLRCNAHVSDACDCAAIAKAETRENRGPVAVSIPVTEGL